MAGASQSAAPVSSPSSRLTSAIWCTCLAIVVNSSGTPVPPGSIHSITGSSWNALASTAPIASVMSPSMSMSSSLPI